MAVLERIPQTTCPKSRGSGTLDSAIYGPFVNPSAKM